MGIHREVFKVHGALCSYSEPREIHTGMDRELEKTTSREISQTEHVAQPGRRKAW